MVGNFHRAVSASPPVGVALAQELATSEWNVITASSANGRINRLADMLRAVYAHRHDYTLAQIDVFSGPAFLWAEATAQALAWLRKPYVLTLHGGGLPQFAARWPGRMRRLLTGAAAVTTPSAYLQEAMRGVRPDIVLLPNGLSLGAYRFRARESPRPHLLWLRAFHHIYQPTLAVEAAALLVQDFPDLRLWMVGPDRRDGSYAATLAAARALRIDDRITFPGGVPKTDVPKWLDRADILLNTATIDNAPVTVIEALAAGLCVVSTAAGGIPHLVQDGRDALLVPVGDAAAMAAAVRRILVDSGLARALSRNGRETACGFDWNVVLPRWELLLRTVMRGTSHA